MQLYFSLQCLSEPAHIREAKQYLLVREKTGNNDGKYIEQWQAFVGIPVGSPYCAAFVSYILNKAKVIYPKIKSAVATRFITEESINADDVYDGRVEIDDNYLAIWRNGKTWKGHIGFVYSWHKQEGYVIEANTSSGYTGSQRDGQGVFIRFRKLSPSKYFRIVSFTKIRYQDEWGQLRKRLSGAFFWLF